MALYSLIGKIRKVLKKTLRFECERDHYFINVFGEQSVFLDLGAGEGDFSAAILKRYPFSTIVLVEPDPDLFGKLVLRFKNQSNIKILNAAIGGESKKNASFYLSRDWEFNSLESSLSLLGGAREGGSQIDIRMNNLEEIFTLFNLKKVDLMKVDIEAGELLIFEKFSKLDSERILQISVEFHDFLNPLLRRRTEECIKKLKMLGYGFIHSGTNFMHGSRYRNCLFYKRSKVRMKSILGFFGVDSLMNSILSGR